jgi:glucose/arabinose dehydrogenase
VRRLVLIIGMLALLVSSVAMPATAAASFSTTLVQDGFSHPIHVTNAGDSRLFVVEQNGLIKIIHDDKSVTTFLDLSSIVVQNGGEQGLLGLAFHPNYASNGLFYVYYSPADGKHEVLAEYKRSSGDPDVADPNSQRILLNLDDPYNNHNGGWMAFKGGLLYLSLGDGGSGGDPENRAQNLKTLWGKILRINPLDPDGSGSRHYSIPSSNPYVGRSGKDEIWSYGLRNPWRCSFDSSTGQLWCGDVGQGLYEEVDRVDSGKAVNFGWRKLEGRHYYNWPGHTAGAVCTSDCKKMPIADYAHSDFGGGNCAVTGGYVSRRPGAAMLGSYVFGDYCSGKVWIIPNSYAAGTALPTPVADTTYKISSFGQGVDGRLYLVDLNGAIYSIDQS